MLNEITEKYHLINKKMLFYAELSAKINITENTIMSHYFNMNQGVKIPEKHHQKVIEVLDDFLEYQKKENILMRKYFNTI